jgi:hypothetical protein
VWRLFVNPVNLGRINGGFIVAKKVDNNAPPTLILEFKTPAGEVWGTLTAEAREFKTGSTGYYCSGKIKNPNNDCRYQVGTNVILIGSKE